MEALDEMPPKGEHKRAGCEHGNSSKSEKNSEKTAGAVRPATDSNLRDESPESFRAEPQKREKQAYACETHAQGEETVSSRPQHAREKQIEEKENRCFGQTAGL